MSTTRTRTVTLLFLFLFIASSGRAQKKDGDQLPGIPEKTEMMTKAEGFFATYWSAREGKVYLEIDEFDKDFLYVNSLAAGLGSNDIGLDRNQLGDNRVVEFQRIGPKVLLVQNNLDYRAVSENEDEVASVEDAFAQSVIFGFKVVASTGNRVLIDLTPLLMTDAHGVASRLKRGKQGTFKIDGSRSAVYQKGTKNFPKNSEFEALLTFTGEAQGSQLRSVAPTANSFSLRLHHSFVALPDDGYEPRVFDPRSGYFQMKFADYATPIDQPLAQRFITRHRLEKKDPTAAVSEAVEPIIYYLDRGAPEPVKSALLEGAAWWNQAFEAAGYKDAFQVKVLPEGADPLDVRYNVINWVHRSTRGWSYGSSVIDPRTGEIIKGHVLLGSLRVRQDFLLAQGLIKAYANGATPDPRMEEMALARLRQLSAHEVGHTIGLAHNFAASVNNRASVMDYPHPYIQLKDGKMDFSEAYAVGIGAWDERTILYGYQDFPEGTDEAAELRKILAANTELGLHYISDADARPAGSSNARAHLWDNGANPTEELKRILELRRVALQNFGLDNLAPGQPLSELEKILTPVYLMHRYQVEATAKQIGGYRYRYEVKGADEPFGLRYTPRNEQQEALAALLSTLAPEELAIPSPVLAIALPPAMGFGRDRELFKTNSGGGLDPLAMAEYSADNTLKFLLHPQRLARIQEQHMRSAAYAAFTLEDYLDEIHRTLRRNVRDNRDIPNYFSLAAAVQRRFASQLMRLAADKSNSEAVNAAAEGALITLKSSINFRDFINTERDNHERYLFRTIARFLEDPLRVKLPPSVPLPDGSPIGCGH